MTPMSETVANRRPIVSSDTESRRASPFRRGARSESAAHVRSEKTAASLGYREICEEVISPLMAGLTERMGTVEARMDTHESANRQKIAGLEARISQLEVQNSRLETANTRLQTEYLARVAALENNLKVVAAVAANHRHHVSGCNKYAYDCNIPVHPQSDVCRKLS